MTTTRRGWLRLLAALSAQSIRHPSMAIALVRVGWRFRRRRWFLRFPFFPLPSREYIRWRMYTAYGEPDAVPSAAEVIRYARWATHR